MATIKGQNLRIMIGEDEQDLQCIAASTNCQVHLALQIEEDTSKDDDSDWLTKSPVGISWDASVDALIVENDSEDDAVKVFKNIMVDLIVNHEFYEDETKSAKLSNKEVTDLIYDSFPSFQKVLKDYSDQVFRAE